MGKFQSSIRIMQKIEGWFGKENLLREGIDRQAAKIMGTLGKINPKAWSSKRKKQGYLIVFEI